MAKTAELVQAPLPAAAHLPAVGEGVPSGPNGGDSGQSALVLFERLATDPNASVEKIERLMALWERAEAKRAETAFNAAMSAAQEAMRPVAADATNPQTKSTYASYAALDRALRPIYSRHGFALSFNTAETPQADTVRVLCDVTNGAHSKQYRLDMPADGKGARGGDVMTRTHATGSAVSYGMRYLLKMIFNIAIGDDDGNRAGAPAPNAPAAGRAAPAGFEDWWIELETAADNGTAKLTEAWHNPDNDKGRAFRRHAFNTNKVGWETLKRKAARVGQ